MSAGRVFDPTDPLGRFAGLAESDRLAMSRVPDKLVVQEWKRRLEPVARELSSPDLAAALEDARSPGRSWLKPDRLRREAWEAVLRRELDRRRSSARS